jgi:hypothetical protein
MNFAVTEEKDSNHRRSKKPLVYIAILILIVAAVVGAALIFKDRRKPPAPIPAKITKQLKIALYYPTELPAGWNVATNSFKIPTSGVLTFAITDNKHNVYYVSEQKLPDNFDYTGFQKKFSEPDSFTAKAGSAIVGPASNALVGSIRTPDNSWVIINTFDTELQNQVETIARSLSPLPK